MENLKPSLRLLSLFKSQPPREFVKLRNVRSSDLETVSNLLLNGISLHRGGFWSGAETRQEWLARVHGDREKNICEDIRVAVVGTRIVGAYALVGIPKATEEAWTGIPATLRLLAIDPEFYSESLAHLLLEDASEICSQLYASQISAELFSTVHPLLPVMEDFGFQRVYGEKAEDALLFFGSRTYVLDLIPSEERGVFTQ